MGGSNTRIAVNLGAKKRMGTGRETDSRHDQLCHGSHPSQPYLSSSRAFFSDGLIIFTNLSSYTRRHTSRQDVEAAFTTLTNASKVEDTRSSRPIMAGDESTAVRKCRRRRKKKIKEAYLLHHWLDRSCRGRANPAFSDASGLFLLATSADSNADCVYQELPSDRIEESGPAAVIDRLSRIEALLEQQSQQIYQMNIRPSQSPHPTSQSDQLSERQSDFFMRLPADPDTSLESSSFLIPKNHAALATTLLALPQVRDIIGDCPRDFFLPNRRAIAFACGSRSSPRRTFDVAVARCRNYRRNNLTHVEFEDEEIRVYWQCFMVECDGVAEIDASRSGIEPLGDTMPLPQSLESCDDRNHIHAIAEHAIRRLLNRILSALYNPDSTHRYSILPPDPIRIWQRMGLPKLLSLSAELNRQLEQWYRSIPEYLRFPKGTDPLLSDRSRVLRIRYYMARQLIYRPFLLQAVSRHQDSRASPLSPLPESDPFNLPVPVALERCETCIDSCVKYLQNVVGMIDKRSPYLWTFAQNCMATLVILWLADNSARLSHLVPAMQPIQHAVLEKLRQWAVEESSFESEVRIIESLIFSDRG
ncbi:hypothetical protein NPX13_g5798 [Xylaria arbuscula]|uniref:Transcription factor domain-containing protein n=1 Tax=Xylaria arbuscula TaxID=114810 RepID=A0A9W8NDS9_9PEZI|nr:hypothetical protein NPX13_g5798 [Xylaria arbuscula]